MTVKHDENSKIRVGEVLTAQVQAQLRGEVLLAAFKKIVDVQPSGTWVADVQKAVNVRDGLSMDDLKIALDQRDAIREAQNIKKNKQVPDTHDDMIESQIATSWTEKSKFSPEKDGPKR